MIPHKVHQNQFSNSDNGGMDFVCFGDFKLTAMLVSETSIYIVNRLMKIQKFIGTSQ